VLFSGVHTSGVQHDVISDSLTATKPFGSAALGNHARESVSLLNAQTPLELTEASTNVESTQPINNV
jgi:hypothetical protein